MDRNEIVRIVVLKALGLKLFKSRYTENPGEIQQHTVTSVVKVSA